MQVRIIGCRPTTYTELARILLDDEKYRHPLMSALGRLGKALESLNEAESRRFGKIPPIQLLVCNQRTGRPGNLALNFLGFKKSKTDKMSKQQLDLLVSAAHQEIFKYQRWHDVLEAFALKPLRLKLPAPKNVLPEIGEIERRSSAEGDDHKRLKVFLARNPKKVGVQSKGIGNTECILLSGDRLDISFRDDASWIAVEVKPKQSPLADLIRGIFQCVKYRAVLAAQLRYEGFESGNHVRRRIPKVILACGGVLPEELRVLSDSLEVEVKSGISVPDDFVP